MIFSYQMTKSDWVAFYRQQHRFLCGIRRKPRLWFRLAVVLLAVPVAFFISRDPLGAAAQMVMISLVFLASFHAFPEVWEPWLVRRFEKTMDHPDNTRAFGPVTMTLTPEHVHVQECGSESTVAWPNIVRADRTDGHIFLYLSTIQALVIARTSLESASFDEVWAEITAYLDRSRHPRDETGGE